jgi:hypothetical protein
MSEKSTANSYYHAGKDAAHEAMIDAVCAVTTDKQTLAIARWWKMKRNGVAAKHLDHYLSGAGGTVEVDLAQLLRQDTGVAQRLTSDIWQKAQMGEMSGTTSVGQFYYRDQDWHFALGGINLNWEIVAPQAMPYKAAHVRVWFTNQYRWHPNEDRITQSIHQAADRLKTKGAAEFTMRGETEIPVPQNAFVVTP